LLSGLTEGIGDRAEYQSADKTHDHATHD
jgi:hypothetical protein